MELFFRGGAGEIGGPNFLQIKGQKSVIGIDCGMQSDMKERGVVRSPNFEGLDCLDGILITHGHLDHAGSIPLLAHQPLSKGCRIYMTPATRDFAGMHFAETLKIAFYSGEKPPFTDKETDAVYRRFRRVSCGEEFRVGEFKVKSVGAGHILGAVGYTIEGGGKKIFATGDFSFEPYPAERQFPPLVEPFDPSGLENKKIDILVIDSTYAGTELPEFDAEVKRFKEDVNKLVRLRKTILIPVFAIDRAQKLWWLLRLLGLEKYAFLHGGITAFKIYQKYVGGALIGAEDRFVYDDRKPHNKKFGGVPRQFVLNKRPSIIIATSGMMIEDTPSYDYAARFIGRDDAAIFFVGYQDPDSPGALLKNANLKQTIFWGGRTHYVKAGVKSYAFTAHGREYEIAHLINAVQPKTVVFTHGEPDRIRIFLNKYPDLPGEKIIAENGVAYTV